MTAHTRIVYHTYLPMIASDAVVNVNIIIVNVVKSSGLHRESRQQKLTTLSRRKVVHDIV